jgi:large subunit ribosomal protein L7e
MSSVESPPTVNVPESVLKKRKRDEQWSLAQAKQAEEAKVKSIENRKIIFKRAEKYIKEYNQQVKLNAC